MSVNSEQRQKSPTQFLDTAAELAEFSLRKCKKFPTRWGREITDSIRADALGIMSNTKQGNSVFVKTAGDAALRRRFMMTAHAQLQSLVSTIGLAEKLFPLCGYLNRDEDGKKKKFARQRLQAHLEKYIRQNGSDGYILIFDFKKFFDSIQHRTVLDVMRKSFTDRKIIGLTMKFVRASGDIGLGLGSQISQSLCLAVPNMLDHAIKERCRMKFFGRYMDDGYIIHKSKEKLKECMEVMKEICERLGLTLNLKKTHIRKLSGGFSFLKRKYHVLPSGKIIKRPSRQSITRMRRRLKRFKKRVEAGLMSLKAVCQSFQSWRSHISKTRCYRSLKRMDELFMQLFGINYKEGCRCITKLCRMA